MNQLRAAIYARYSTDKQNPASCEDQAVDCQAIVKLLGGIVVGTYADPDISGYRRDRSGLLQMLDDVSKGLIDIVICEAVDRIARDAEDISWLGKKFRFHRVRFHTGTEGEIDEIKLAVASLVGSMFLTNHRTKTVRGMKGNILAGRVAGGRTYGYRKRCIEDGSGRGINGHLDIEPGEALVVQRIFREFASGLSSIAIAAALNRDGIASPRGGEWNASTIRGDRKKLVGILNNPLYSGVLVWNRREWRRDPDSEKRERRYRLRPKEEWLSVDLPDLRIVDASLVEAVEQELERRSLPPGKVVPSAGRSKHLLSGLIKCGTCGANFTISGKNYYRCSHQRERGTCTNRLSVRLNEVEGTVLEALHDQLLTPETTEVFFEEFRREVARLSSMQSSGDQQTRSRLQAVNKEIDNLAKNMLEGVVSPTVRALLEDRELEKARLQRQLQSVSASTAAILLPTPEIIRIFQEKVATLREALTKKETRVPASVIISRLIDRVTVSLNGAGDTVLDIEAISGSLISYATNKESPHRGGGCSIALVAGAGFEPATFRL